MKPNISHNNVIAEHAYLSEKAQMWVEGPSSAPEKITPFTLDDGLNHTDSMQTLNALKAGGVYGTFLVVGNPVSSTPETFKRETTEGCSIAVYSHIHNYNKFYPGRVGSLEATEDEYGKTKATPKEILGVDLKTNTWRCSGGHMNQKGLEVTNEALAAEGVHWIDWNCLTGDVEPENHQPKNAADMIKAATSAVGEGLKVAVAFAHNAEGEDMTVKVMSQIASTYKEAGYRFGIIA